MKKHKLTLLTVTLLCVFTLLFTGCSSDNLQNIGEKSPIKYEEKDGHMIVKEISNKSNVTHVVIPDEVDGLPVTEIADFSGVNLEALESITIGKNIEAIGTWAFENNQKLQKFIVSPENTHFCDQDGVLFSKDMKTLLFYPLAKDVQVQADESGSQKPIKFSVYQIPDGVEIISTKAFYKCGILKSISIPDSVKEIQEMAFFRCGALEEVKLPSALTHIGKDAFSYCSGLQEIRIPKAVTQIDDYAFFNCTALCKVCVEGAENDMQLGKKWQPTDNGRKMDKLVIEWDCA